MQQQYLSFPGGQVMSYQALNLYLARLNLLSDPQAPQLFSNGAEISFTFLEIYPWKQTSDKYNTPLEFVWRPADHRLLMWFVFMQCTFLIGFIYQIPSYRVFEDDDAIPLWNEVVSYFYNDK